MEKRQKEGKRRSAGKKEEEEEEKKKKGLKVRCDKVHAGCEKCLKFTSTVIFTNLIIREFVTVTTAILRKMAVRGCLSVSFIHVLYCKRRRRRGGETLGTRKGRQIKSEELKKDIRKE